VKLPTYTRDQVTDAFSYVLRVARKKANLTQQALADAGGFDQSFINRMEKGLRLPSLETVITLEQVMKLPAGTLTRLTTEELNNPIRSPATTFRSARAQIDSSATPDDEETEGEHLPL
jgi:transcriptional regulator with XRE-family HTH domain